MNNLKKTETVITFINTAALLGASIYFYRKINNLEQELNKHSEHLTSTVKKVREMVIYKKHIAILENAIKKFNFTLEYQNRDIETLKEIVKYQSNQITEIHSFIKSLKGEEPLEIKWKDNVHLQPLLYPQQNFRQIQNDNFGGYQQSNFNQRNFNQQQAMNQGYQQNMNQQGYQQQAMNNQGFNQGMNNQGFNQGMNNQGNFNQRNFNQQGYNQGYNQGMNNQGYNQGMNEQGYNQRRNQFDENEDEDATIDAVRRARANQQNEDLLGGLF